MKRFYKVFYPALAITAMAILMITACQKLDFSAVTKSNIEEVNILSADKVEVAVDIFDLSEGAHPDYGVCYSETEALPTITGNKVSKGSLTGTKKETISITGLQPGSKIYIRAYVMNGNIPQYSFNVEEATLPQLPVVTTQAATTFTQTTATLNGLVNANGTVAITSFEFGTSATYSQTLEATPDTVTGATNTPVKADITGLTANTKYYFRVKVSSEYFTLFGKDTTFITSEIALPDVTTSEITNIMQNTAIGGGNVTSDGGTNLIARGVCWSISLNPTINDSHTVNGTGIGSFIADLSGLAPNVQYYVVAYATNSLGTVYGNQVTFTTLQISVPIVTTTEITNITQNSSESGGNVTTDGGATVIGRGVCWSTSQNPTISDSHTTNGSGSGIFTSDLVGLSANTVYYVMAYATNSVGTSYGNQESFTTLNWQCGDNFTDPRDNKVYSTVQIGTQCWMKQNLNIGTSISGNNNQTNNATIEKYCYNNSETNCNTYGGLYQWDEMMQYITTQGVQGICAPGWHLPTDAEWTTLTDYLGGASVAGGKMKEAGTAHWSPPNTGATNSSGFTALPGGLRSTTYDTFGYMGSNGYFWSSTETSTTGAGDLYLDWVHANVYRNSYNKGCGFSVRCLRDL